VDDGFHTVAFLMFVHCGFAHPQNKSYRNLPNDQYFRYHDALRRTQDASRYEKKPSINALMKEPVWRWQITPIHPAVFCPRMIMESGNP
jgi:hypothetical protein